MNDLRLEDATMCPWSNGVHPSWGAHRLKWLVARMTDKVADTTRPYVGLENVEPWTGRFVEAASEDKAEGQSSIFEKGDILFGKLRPYLAKVHRAGYAGCCTSELLVLRPNKLIGEYLQYVLVAEPFIKLVDSSTFGAKMPRADWDFIGRVVVPCPPVPVQRAIADFLRQKTATIDALIERKEWLLQLLVERRLAVIAHAVTRGPDPTAQVKESGVEWLGSIPQHWKVRRIKHVARLESGHTPDRSEPAYWRDDNDIPWVSLNDTKALAENDYISDTALHVNEIGLANSSAHLLPARVVVFTRDATIGKAAITTRPMAVSQHIIAWVCGPLVHPEYLLYVFYAMERELVRSTMGATIRTIGMPDVRKLVTPLPPLHEQKAIASFLSEATNRIATIQYKIEQQVKALREYRRAIITAAVTGQVDTASREAA